MIWNCNDVGLFDVCTFTVTLKLCESFLQRRYYPLGINLITKKGKCREHVVLIKMEIIWLSFD